MNYGGANRREPFGQLDQVPVPDSMFVQIHFWQGGARTYHFGRRSDHLCATTNDHFPALIDTLTVKADPVPIHLLGGNGDRDGDRITQGHRVTKVQRLPQINRPRSGEFGAKQGRD